MPGDFGSTRDAQCAFYCDVLGLAVVHRLAGEGEDEYEQVVALVTGAGQNAGAGITRALAARGAAVAVNDLVPARRARAVWLDHHQHGQS